MAVSPGAGAGPPLASLPDRQSLVPHRAGSPEARTGALPDGMTALGIVLILALAVLYGLGIRAILQVPFRALGILVGGMAFHNLVLMILLRLGTPHVLVRIAQAWKEGILLLLLLLALRQGAVRWRGGWRPRLRFLDWLMLAFALLALVYSVLPGRLFPAPTTL